MRIALLADLFLCSPSAWALDDASCRPYVMIHQLGITNQAAIKFIWLRFDSTCDMIEGLMPEPPATWQDGMRIVLPGPVMTAEPAPGTVPAMDRPVVHPPKPEPVAAKTSTPTDPRLFCAKFHRRAVWQLGGKSWNCRP